MSTSLSVILKRFALLFGVAVAVLGVLMIFSYDVIKIDWVSFMEIQPSFKPMEDPLARTDSTRIGSLNMGPRRMHPSRIS